MRGGVTGCKRPAVIRLQTSLGRSYL